MIQTLLATGKNTKKCGLNFRKMILIKNIALQMHTSILQHASAIFGQSIKLKVVGYLKMQYMTTHGSI